MAVIRITKAVAEARKEIQARLIELMPQMAEYEILQAQLEIIEAADKKIAALQVQVDKLKRPAATLANVNKWAEALPPDEIVRAGDLAAEFGKHQTWARNHLNRLVKVGVLEKWGKGGYRPVPDRTGSATLHVVTA